MKRHTTYKKINRPYFNWKELLEIPIIPLTITTTISYGTLYSLGVVVTIIINVLVALGINYYFHGLKNAFSPRSNTYPSKNISGIVVLLSMLPSFLIILGAQLITAVGPYLIVVYQKTGMFYGTYFLLWGLIVFGLPTLYFLIREANYWFTVYFQAYHFNTVSFILNYDPELLISIQEISFLNTDKKLRNTFTDSTFRDFNNNGQLSSPTSIAEYNEIFYKPALKKSMAIPKQANILSITYTSSLEGMLYHEEVVFPYDKLHFEQEKYPINKSKFLRGKKSDDIIFSIKERGILHLYDKTGSIIAPIQLSKTPLSEEEKQKNLSMCEVNLSPSGIINKEPAGAGISSAREPLKKRTAIKEQIFKWQLTGTGFKDHEIRVTDVQNYLLEDEKIGAYTIAERPLPLSFEFIYGHYRWLIIHFNPEKLIDQMLPAELNDAETVFDFNVSIDLQKGKVDFKLLFKGSELLFSDWEKEITAHRWEDAKNKLLKKQQHNQNQAILSRIYNLMQQKDYPKAQEICKQEIQLQPDFALLYFYEARLLFYTQGYEASYLQKEYFIEKTKDDPFALARIYNNYGCLLDEEKRYKEALPYFEKAYATYPDETMYIANIAEIFHKLKQPELAVQFAKKCIERGNASDIIHEILKDNKKVKEVAIIGLHTKLADLATQYRASVSISEQNEIISNYYKVYEQFIQFHGCIIPLDPDAELPDDIMPKEYTDLWK